MDDEAFLAQQGMKVSKPQAAIVVCLKMQNEKEMLQQGNGGLKSFKMLFGLWRNQGYSSFFKGFTENVLLQKCKMRVRVYFLCGGCQN